MKKSVGSIIAVALLIVPGQGIAKRKEDVIDPRLKQMHTIFMKGSFEAIQQVQANQEEIEKDSCLKVAQEEGTADAIVKVSYVPGGTERISSANIQNPDQAITQIRPFHTALEVSIREGSKMKKIWEKHVDLDQPKQSSRLGVLRLMDQLRHDACEGR